MQSVVVDRWRPVSPPATFHRVMYEFLGHALGLVRDLHVPLSAADDAACYHVWWRCSVLDRLAVRPSVYGRSDRDDAVQPIQSDPSRGDLVLGVDGRVGRKDRCQVDKNGCGPQIRILGRNGQRDDGRDHNAKAVS